MMSGEMTTETTQSELDSQWDMLLHWLPRGWQDAVGTFGAVNDRFKIPNKDNSISSKTTIEFGSPALLLIGRNLPFCGINKGHAPPL